MGMSAAPERIWADPPSLFDGVDLWHMNREGAEVAATEYIRADLHQSAVAAARAGWQPIETAPKDEAPHVRGLWVTSNRTKAKWWEEICGHVDDGGDFVDHDGNSPWRAEDYTHWMPLPEPPK